MRRRQFKRRLFWTGVILALVLVWLTVQVLRVAEAIVSTARRPRAVPLGSSRSSVA